MEYMRRLPKSLLSRAEGVLAEFVDPFFYVPNQVNQAFDNAEAVKNMTMEDAKNYLSPTRLADLTVDGGLAVLRGKIPALKNTSSDEMAVLASTAEGLFGEADTSQMGDQLKAAIQERNAKMAPLLQSFEQKMTRPLDTPKYSVNQPAAYGKR